MSDINQLLTSEEVITIIEDLAGVSYSPEKIALYLCVDKKEFMKYWYNHDSEVRIAYDRGMLKTEFSILQKQKELAVSGNITSSQVALKEAERIRTQNTLNQVLFGYEED